MHSQFIVYVDESEVRRLLTYCAVVFLKSEYVDRAVPRVQSFKFDMFGHDMVNLHSVDIRSKKCEPYVGQDENWWERFYSGLTECLAIPDYTIIATCCRTWCQRGGREQAVKTSVQYLLERIYNRVTAQGSKGRVFIVFETPSQQEQEWITSAFNATSKGENWMKEEMDVQLRFAPKMHNSTGMQFADLAAYPIAMHVLGTLSSGMKRSFDVVKKKIRSYDGQVEGFGLKVFPEERTYPPGEVAG